MHVSGQPVIDAQTVAALRRYDSPTIANGIETFDIRPRTAGFMNASVRCIFPEMGVTVGFAMTARCRAAVRAERAYSRHGWWEALASAPRPRIAVIQDVDEPPVGAFWGEVQANIHRALGCDGVVTNGGVRDLNEVRALGFAYFAGSVMVSHAYVHMLDFGSPVQIGGLDVSPGDLLHADQHGVIVIPPQIAADLPAACDRIIADERRLIGFCQSPEFSVEGLKARVP